MHPEIRVGILSSPRISFSLKGNFRLAGSDKLLCGDCRLSLKGDTAILSCQSESRELSLPIVLKPVETDNTVFTLKKVIIGIDFHWQRAEDQTFKGSLSFIKEGDKLRALNIIDIEDYLSSVISSEMSASSSPELLKAHAVISRSWLLAQIQKGSELKTRGNYHSTVKTADGYLKWYDREEHEGFDVCADDHCQRYQGISRASSEAVKEAIKASVGVVLSYKAKICDARFSKCCGGVTESFENVWEPVPHPYLTRVVDAPAGSEGENHDLTNEAGAERWIRNKQDSYCNVADLRIINEVLNGYDRETSDFYRWQTTLTQEEIQGLFDKKLGLNVGEVLELVPIKRGVSGRIISLRIEGTKSSITIGKELEIRKALSESHLYSSAFVVEAGQKLKGLPQSFTLIGAGWGHGVGLCQIGAAVMAAKGFDYKAILNHYFAGAKLEKIY